MEGRQGETSLSLGSPSFADLSCLEESQLDGSLPGRSVSSDVVPAPTQGEQTLPLGGCELILESYNTQRPANGWPQGAGTPSSPVNDEKKKYIVAYDDHDEYAGFAIPMNRVRPSKLKLGLRETSTGDSSSQCDVAVNVVVKKAVGVDEGLTEGSNADVAYDDDDEYLCFSMSLKRMKHSKFKLGLRETSTGDQSSQCEIAGQDMVKNAVEPDEKLAEESKAWATQLGIRYQTLQHRLQDVYNFLSKIDLECSELRQGIERRDALIATLRTVHNSTEGSDAYGQSLFECSEHLERLQEECGRLANVVSGLKASHAAVLKDKDELHLARCAPKTFQPEAPVEPQKVLESMSGCATRLTGIVDVDTCHNKNGEPRDANGELSDIRDDGSEESGKTELNESANEGDDTGVASAATV